MARRQGDMIAFVLRQRHSGLDRPTPVPFDSRRAEPMRRALSGQSGTMVGPDYRGVEVLAAYEPVAILDLGIVAKIDVAEIRATFKRAGAIVAGTTFFFVAVGTALFFRVGNPMIRRIYESEERTRRILESAGEGIYGLDREGKITFINSAAAEMIGWRPEDLIGKTQHGILHHTKPDGSPCPREECLINAAIRDGKVHRVTDEVFWRKDGTSLPVEFTSTPVLERDKPVGAVVVFRDITERKQAENEIRQMTETLEERVRLRTAELTAANREMEAFTYSVSHDLRAPLRAIDGFSQALFEEYGDKLDGDARTYLQYLREGSQEMGDLIDDMLTLSRSTRGEIKREKVNLSDLAAAVAADLRKTEPGRKADFKITRNVTVDADPRLMRVVLENLLGNAWKFTRNEPEARIEFGAGREDGKTVCFVRDNGAGFDMVYADKLFAPFQRLHGSQEFEGSGIGLASVQRILNRHGGRVWAKGSVGEGATIYFEL